MMTDNSLPPAPLTGAQAFVQGSPCMVGVILTALQGCYGSHLTLSSSGRKPRSSTSLRCLWNWLFGCFNTKSDMLIQTSTERPHNGLWRPYSRA